MTKTMLALLAGGVSLIAGAAGAQTANLVKNGDFEQLTDGYGQVAVNASGSQVTSGTYITSARDWYAPPGNRGYPELFFTANGVAGYESSWDQATRYLYGTPTWDGSSSVGGAYLVMGTAERVGTLSQAIGGLTVGQSYDLSFSWAAAESKARYGPNSAAYSASLSAMIDGQILTTPTVNVAAEGFSGWMTAVYSFTYGGGSNILSFQAAGSPAAARPMVLLDGIGLAATPALPEPATWAMMLVGFGMVGATVRYRRRTVAASLA